MAQMVKNLPVKQETWVRSLGWEDPLEKEMVTPSSSLAWRIPWTEEPGGLHTVYGVAKSWTRLSDFTFIDEKGFPGGSVVKNPPANVGDAGSVPGSEGCLEEGNGNPLQYSCMRNPMDRRAWWATVLRVAKRQILARN